jgi:rubrerythrin
MPAFTDTKTYDNLKQAFARESQASHRYLYFAQKADIEGYPELAALFRSVADSETGHAFGHLDFLTEADDARSGRAIGDTADNLRSAIQAETYEYAELYPAFARIAREEGLDSIGEWFETLAQAENDHAERLVGGLAQVT